MFPELGSIGPLTFYAFGLMAALALIIPGFFLAEDLKDRGMDAARAFEIMFAAGLGGFAGARVYYAIEHRGAGAGLLSGSGLVWYGGVIGGTIGVVLISLWRRLPLGVLANLAAPPLALAYAIGRIGCQLAGDGDYGERSDLPWSMSYPHGTVPTRTPSSPRRSTRPRRCSSCSGCSGGCGDGCRPPGACSACTACSPAWSASWSSSCGATPRRPPG